MSEVGTAPTRAQRKDRAAGAWTNLVEEADDGGEGTVEPVVNVYTKLKDNKRCASCSLWGRRRFFGDWEWREAKPRCKKCVKDAEKAKDAAKFGKRADFISMNRTASGTRSDAASDFGDVARVRAVRANSAQARAGRVGAEIRRRAARAQTQRGISERDQRRVRIRRRRRRRRRRDDDPPSPDISAKISRRRIYRQKSARRGLGEVGSRSLRVAGRCARGTARAPRAQRVLERAAILAGGGDGSFRPTSTMSDAGPRGGRALARRFGHGREPSRTAVNLFSQKDEALDASALDATLANDDEDEPFVSRVPEVRRSTLYPGAGYVPVRERLTSGGAGASTSGAFSAGRRLSAFASSTLNAHRRAAEARPPAVPARRRPHPASPRGWKQRRIPRP